MTESLRGERIGGLPDPPAQPKSALDVDASENGGVDGVRLVVDAGPKVACQGHSGLVHSSHQIGVQGGEADDRGGTSPGAGSRLGRGVERTAGTVKCICQGR